jgi:hypothetical protein
MRSFCSPDLIAVADFPRGNQQGVMYRELNGLEVVVEYIFCLMSCSPDSFYFIHDTRLVGNEDGTTLISSKFTVTGSRLYVVTAEVDGKILPNAPAVSKLYNELEKAKLEQSSMIGADNSGQFAISQAGGVQEQLTESKPNIVKSPPLVTEGMEAIKQSVVFRTDSTNKYDRYKMHKTGTIGALVNYKEFSENSLRVRERSSAAGSNNSSSSSGGTNTTTTTSSTGDCEMKNSADSQPTCDVKNQKVGEIASSTADTTLLNARKRALPPEEVMVAGREVRFGHSAMLPMPVRVSIIGVQKFYVNSNNKVVKLEWLAYYQ